MSEFREILKKTLGKYELSVREKAIKQLCVYHDLLIERNKVMNLTALTEPQDVALKHFADSMMLLQYAEIPQGASVIDVGTGAGFPGMVLKIVRPDIRLTLLDSLQKRLGFLEEVCGALGFTDVELIHARAEEGSRTELRDSFDVAVSRAVAGMNTLCEYDMPYVKIGGRFIAMKGKGAEDELSAAQNAIRELCGELKAVHSFELGEAGERAIIEIEKIAPTPEKYPRKSKQIKNKAL